MPTEPVRADRSGPHRLVRAPGQYLRRRTGPADHVTHALVGSGADSGTYVPGVGAAETARRSPTRIELPESVDARLTQAVEDRARAATKAALIDRALRELLADFAHQLEHPGPFTAPPPGRRVPRGQWTHPGPRRSITVKFDPALLEQARGFLQYCRQSGIDPRRVDGITTLNELVAVALERRLDASAEDPPGVRGV